MAATALLLYIIGFNTIWMGWNIFLGIIPLILGKLLFGKDQTHSAIWLFGFVLYILFLPNAPYIFTDIIHLYKLQNYVANDAINIAIATQFVIFLSIGYFLFVQSYHYFEDYITRRYHVHKLLLRTISFVIISIGVYMGRVLRLNSWDIVTSPIYVAQSIAHLMHTPALQFIALFTAFIMAVFAIHEQVRAAIAARS